MKGWPRRPWGLYLLIEEKLIFVSHISHLFPFLSCRPPRDLDSKACISIGEEVRLGVLVRRPLRTGDHPRLAAVVLAACPGRLLMGLLNFSPPQKKGRLRNTAVKKKMQPILLEMEGSCWMNKS